MGLFDTVSVGVGMTPMSCYKCGVRFDVPTGWNDKRQADHESFWCPNGHSQAYLGKSEAERLRDELARERARLDQVRADVERQRRIVEMERRRSAAARGQVTKIRNRVAKGSCPCCHRTFKDLRDHMREQHPDWSPEAGADAIPPRRNDLRRPHPP